jgi:hypothetical protein
LNLELCILEVVDQQSAHGLQKRRKHCQTLAMSLATVLVPVIGEQRSTLFSLPPRGKWWISTDHQSAKGTRHSYTHQSLRKHWASTEVKILV